MLVTGFQLPVLEPLNKSYNEEHNLCFAFFRTEAIVTYDDFEFYAGLGYRGDDFRGLTIPVGINVYPFEVKKFGFHIELTPILGEESLLRGSWGIRYRFKSQD